MTQFLLITTIGVAFDDVQKDNLSRAMQTMYHVETVFHVDTKAQLTYIYGYIKNSQSLEMRGFIYGIYYAFTCGVS